MKLVFQLDNLFSNVLPISDGDLAIVIPHSSILFILSCAVPLPPEIIAPAWPILLPGGAVIPATKPTVGFLILWFFKNSEASSSAVPPISPIIKIDLVSTNANAGWLS